ncbi:hypothetical protein Tco_1433422 [Tanacetum coccineum]
MDLETTQTNTTAKLPLLKQGEYEMWKLRIEKYFLVQDYALWDVIENGNSFKPVTRTTTNADGTSTSLIPGPYKDAKTLFAAIQTRFGGNDATKEDSEDSSETDIVEQEVKGIANSSSSLSSQNMAFMSSSSSTNDVNTAYEVNTANIQVSPASTQVSIAELEDKKVFPEDWECRGSRKQDSRNWNQENSKRTINMEDTSSKAMLAIVGAGSQIPDKSRKGLRFASYNVVPPPHTGLFAPPTLDLSNSGLEEFQQHEFEGYGPKISKNVSEDVSNEVRKSLDASLVEEANQVNAVKASACWGHPQQEDQGYVDSGCSRHMIGNMSYLSNFKEFDGGYVTFGGGAKGGRITSKGTLKIGKLDFEDVYFVKELQFNLFSVSQMCNKKNSVLFTDTGCFVLSPDFKLTDESQVLLKVSRKNNMYSVDMKNIVPKESLPCLVAKATLDESML